MFLYLSRWESYSTEPILNKQSNSFTFFTRTNISWTYRRPFPFWSMWHWQELWFFPPIILWTTCCSKHGSCLAASGSEGRHLNQGDVAISLDLISLVWGDCKDLGQQDRHEGTWFFDWRGKGWRGSRENREEETAIVQVGSDGDGAGKWLFFSSIHTRHLILIQCYPTYSSH